MVNLPIDGPQDLKSMSLDALTELCDLLRAGLIERVTETGGHIGSNLGLIEATVAMHYVFDSPTDKIVFDVSHQSYVHKMITGRYADFMAGKTSGYTNPRESAHDPFMVGHTSTSVSLAVGLAKGREILGGTERIVAVLGDGSLSGGEAFEGLDNAALVKGNLIIVFNDNEMSIAENRGGIYAGLKHLRETDGQGQPNLFRALGLDYLYVAEGNDLSRLIEAFNRVKDYDHPVVLHIHTQKGKGLAWAEREQERCHWIAPSAWVAPREPLLSTVIADRLAERVEAGADVVVINAATPGAAGLSPEWRARMGERFVDVGICEEHAVAFASGIAARGAKPVWVVLSSFVQRTYDQLVQDLALNGNPAVILVYNGGMGYSDPTHAGLYDMSMMSNIPGLLCYAPTSEGQLFATLDWALSERERPVVIRVPASLPRLPKPTSAFGGWQIWHQGKDVALLALGNMAEHAMSVCYALHAEGVDATLVACDCYSEVDSASLTHLLETHSLFVTLEDGILAGGFGQKVAAYLADKDCKVLLRGAAKSFVDRRDRAMQFTDNRLNADQILADIRACLSKD
jgi:1-deoxy-D-xylulose-5-phosphate synthase